MERLADPLLAILVFTFLGQNRFLLPYGIWNRRRREAGAAGSFPEGYRPDPMPVQLLANQGVASVLLDNLDGSTISTQS